MHPHFVTKFAVRWNHETTVGSQIEILSSFARDFSSTAQHLVCTSGVFRSEIDTNRLHRTLQLHRQECTHRWQFDRVFHLLLHLDRSLDMCSLQLLCPGSSSPIRFGLLMAPRSIPSENGLAELSLVCSQPSCHPTALQSPFHSSQLQPTSNQELSVLEWSVGDVCADSEFLHLSLISGSQVRTDQFARFHPWTNLWHLWTFLLICPHSPRSLLCHQSWTMTCFVCLCQMVACRCHCVQCSLVGNVLHRT